MDLARALQFSRYATRAFDAEPALAAEIVAALDAPFAWPQTPHLDGADSLARSLRTLRRRVFLHTMLRDLTRRAPLGEVCTAMTTLADLALRSAVQVHVSELDAIHGAPIGSESGTPQELIVVGMGKLGGGELNVSSDIDLVFVYPEEGDTAGPRVISNREYFDRLGRRVVTALNDVTADGYVFRVDMRLRPYSESAALTTSFAGLEHYLLTQGRAWERYAWLKARPVTGERHDELMSLVTPFVYRKYLDYDAYEGLRDVHRQIREQSVQRDTEANVKLGDGGIREIEFIAQAQQIVRGGREPDLRMRATMGALAALGERGLLPGSSADALTRAYVFLREVEHRLQYRDDMQTHALPEDAAARHALAEAMNATDAAFEQDLARHRGVVSFTFAETFGDSAGGAAQCDAIYEDLWRNPVASAESVERLHAAGFADPQALAATLVRVRNSGRYQQLPAASRQRFDTLVPQLLATASAHPGLSGAQVVFDRLLSLLETVARRSAYLALVIEHPPLLPRVANVLGASAWAAEYLTSHPLLLDELLDARALLAEPDWDVWREELSRLLAQRTDDAEHQMDVLRHFRHAQTFRLLAQDLSGRLSVERLADHLSALADIVLEAALAACWAQFAGLDAAPPRFSIIGYGKLGGKELGYVSDLDLVFLFDVAADDPDAHATEFAYTRLAQRLITWLTSTTSAGPLYDTDLRLRPDGAKGTLVSSLAGFAKYQRASAWLWEHQALTRARFVAGDADVGAAFEQERLAILTQKRDPRELAEGIAAMRRRMYAGHPNATALFDLKHDEGGMVDIEFTVQCLVLGHAHEHATLTRNAGNIALLHLAGELALVPGHLAREVADAYRDYRRLQHKVRLTGAAQARVDPAPHASQRAAVNALWKQVFGAAWRQPPGST